MSGDSAERRDRELRDWMDMGAVGRERFWLPAANRYPFKTLLAIKELARQRATKNKLGAKGKLVAIKKQRKSDFKASRRFGELAGAHDATGDVEGPCSSEGLGPC